MNKFIKTEFLKEKRSANGKLTKLVPLIYVIFTSLVVLVMVRSIEGKSYLLAAAYNWYPILILPIVLSTLVVNIITKEKNHHINFYKSLGLDQEKVIWAKFIVVIFHLLIILLASGLLLFIVGSFILNDTVRLLDISKATILTFVGSLPIISFSLLLMITFSKNFLVYIINFILSIIGPVIAIKNLWIIYPHSYTFRMLAPAVGINPNGTFLEEGSYLANPSAIYIGIILSLIISLIFVGASSKIYGRAKND